jgi:hypothetical protein
MKLLKYAIGLISVIFLISAAISFSALVGMHRDSGQRKEEDLVDVSLVAELCRDLEFSFILDALLHPDAKVRATALMVWLSISKTRPLDTDVSQLTDAVISIVASDRFPFAWLDYGGRLSNDMMHIFSMHGKTHIFFRSVSLIDGYAFLASAYVYRAKLVWEGLSPWPRTSLTVTSDVCF